MYRLGWTTRGSPHAALQCAQMPEISITGVFGTNPAARDAFLIVSATAAEAASPTAPHFSQIRNTTGSSAFMTVHACDEGISALDPMHKLLFAKEIECAIDRDRRRACTATRQPVDKFIGAKRLMTRQQSLQHLATHGRQPLLAGGTDRLGVRDRVAGATSMIVARLWEYRGRG